jgi:hypothetical protein
MHGRDAVLALERGDGLSAEGSYNEAVRLYGLLLRNVGDDVTIQVWMELGEMNRHYGAWMERLDLRPRAIEAYGHALLAFLKAHELQKAGRGRVLEPEVLHAADSAATLCVQLAQLDNPEIDQVVDTGKGILRFLEERTGKPETLRTAQLLLAYTIRHRTEDPDDKALWFQRILDGLEDVERREGVELPFLKAQALYYLSVGGRSREGLLRACALYEAAAAKDRSVRLRALIYAARGRCTVATLFRDDAVRDEALRLLEALPEAARREGLRMDGVLRMEYEGLLRSCGQ